MLIEPLVEDHAMTAKKAAWPAEAAMILSALDAGSKRYEERRQHRRLSHRVLALLRLFSDRAGDSPWQLYTRDACPRGIGFITPHRLPLGYGGMVELAGPKGEPLSVQCTLFRCREASPGWFEGALYFTRHQTVFGDEKKEIAENDLE